MQVRIGVHFDIVSSNKTSGNAELEFVKYFKW